MPAQKLCQNDFRRKLLSTSEVAFGAHFVTVNSAGSARKIGNFQNHITRTLWRLGVHSLPTL